MGTKKYNILLLTNRDSDNMGDLVIEQCAVALISAVMKNLGVDYFKIKSRAAGMISRDYLRTRDENLLVSAETSIKNADVIVFGGAPLFNWHHQNFYERTAVTIELAQKYGKPVIFSSIGIEGYEEGDSRCQRLKEALKSDCVRQITTRDDFESLKKFVDNKNIFLDKVSDSAVFSDAVFGNYRKPTVKKKVGIFILRAEGFKDNDIDYTKEDAASLWKGLITELEEKGYDYEIVTSGHFSDEAFMDLLIREYGVKKEKCVFNVNLPETLVERISSYSAVVSCRLHPSIIAYSFGIPAVGVVWNSKVSYFYDSIGYSDRVISTDVISPQKLMAVLEEAMEQGVHKDTEYLMSVYDTLFRGIREAVEVDGDPVPWDYETLVENLPVFKGTSEAEKMVKLERKFRRTYESYNKIARESANNKEQLNSLFSYRVRRYLKRKLNQYIR